ncbi:hypothetical protein Tco_0393744 [Tanacetum coccineum]
MLKCHSERCTIRFEKRGKLNPRYIGPFKILKRVGPMAYKLELPEELSNVYSTFHVSNLKKCLSDESLVIPMKELRLDDKLNFVKEPIKIMDQEVKQLRQSRIPIVKHVYLRSCLKESYATSDVLSAQWDRCNAMVLTWIMNVVSQDVYMGLVYSENVDKPVRSSLLTRDPLPEVKDAYNVISREESHRGLLESSGGTESKQNATSFVAKTFNNNKKQFNNNGNNFTIGTSSNANRGPNPNLNCKHYGKIGHTIDRCFEIVGFPQGFKRNFNSNSNTGKQSFNANFDVKMSDKSSSSSLYSGFTSEQIQKLLNLINDKSFWKHYLPISQKILGTGSESGGLYLFDVNKSNCIRLSSYVLNGKSPYELVYNKKPNLSHFRDVKFYENVFPFKHKTCDLTDVENTSKVDHLKFFDSQLPQSPYDDERDSSNEKGSLPHTGSHDSTQDVNNAFLYGDLLEDLYMTLPKGKYCLELLHEYGLLAARPVDIPLPENSIFRFKETSNDKYLADLFYPVGSNPFNSFQFVKPRYGAVLSKKQATISKSSSEAEYRSMSTTSSEVVWLGNLLHSLGLRNLYPIELFCDNSSAIQIVANPVFHERTKHFELDVHFVREKVLAGIIKTVKISSGLQTADVFTKCLGGSGHANTNCGIHVDKEKEEEFQDYQLGVSVCLSDIVVRIDQDSPGGDCSLSFVLFDYNSFEE